MANINLSIPHQLSKDEALKIIKKLLDKTKKEHPKDITNLKESWKKNVGSFNFTLKRFEISGIITVDQSKIELNGTFPFALSFFKEKIKKIITQEAEKLLL